jgi:hypothetical protein
MHYIKESIFVGILVGVIGLIVSTSIMFLTDDKFTVKKYTFWPSVLASFVITGIISHIIFEIVGINKWYCKNGYSCAK